jgi:ABC-type nitrate/sulfonate/bicarbonate transport system substrate-binding protein
VERSYFKKRKMIVGHSTITATNLPAWLAKETGIFAKNGLDVSSPMSEEEPRFQL